MKYKSKDFKNLNRLVLNFKNFFNFIFKLNS